jgi:hypothetical protein
MSSEDHGPKGVIQSQRSWWEKTPGLSELVSGQPGRKCCYRKVVTSTDAGVLTKYSKGVAASFAMIRMWPEVM